MLLLASAGIVSGTLSRIARADSLALKINYYDTFVPYSFLHESQVRGVFVDIVNEVLGRRGGLSLTHQAMPWARAQQEVKDNLADAFCTLESDARREYVDFSREPFLKMDNSVVFAKNHPQAERIKKIKTSDDLKQFLIGTYLGDSRIETLFKGMKVDAQAVDMKQVLQKIAAGRTDVTIIGNIRWKYYAREAGVRDKLDDIPFDNVEYRFGVRKSHPAVGKILNLFDKTIVAIKKDGTLERIINAYG